MATVKKSKKKVIVPICIILVIAIVAGTVFGVVKSKSGEEVKLNTIATGDIYEKVSLTGDVTAGTSKEYKVGTVATVKNVNVKVGDQVKKGDVLATFDTTSLDGQVSSLQASYNDAVKNYNTAVANQKSAKNSAASLKKEVNYLDKKIAKLKKKMTKTTTTKKNKKKKPLPRPLQLQQALIHSGFLLQQLKLLQALLQLSRLQMTASQNIRFHLLHIRQLFAVL